MNDFLPISIDDMRHRGWDCLDFVMVTGDAYVDHPSFGAAVIARLLEKHGYRVGVIAQPDWKSGAAFRALGAPRIGFLVTAGNLDSMVNNYTVAKKKRNDDVYSPGRSGGRRPDRAAISYSIRIREAYGRVPIILGGLEASLRRLAHFDYWQEKVRKSVLIDSGADLIVYGMGERPIVEIAGALREGKRVSDITDVRGTVWRAKTYAPAGDDIVLPAFEAIQTDRRAFAESFHLQYDNSEAVSGRRLIEPYADCRIIQNPPALPLASAELDEVYELPYVRAAHPVYDREGGVSAIEEVRFSLTVSRGCFGNCSFCSLTFHQGRTVQSRSADSVVNEARLLTRFDDFKGYIHDVGGPTANFTGPACARQTRAGTCSDRECLAPVPCKNLDVSHESYLALLRRLRALPGVKKVFIRSGLRYDYLLADPDQTFFRELVEHHVSGQLKVAPEHVSGRVLALMNKPARPVYERFRKKFEELNRVSGKNQFLLPYFISSHPGATLEDAIELACYFRDNRFAPEQVQDFYPTPGTLSTCMYHSGLDPRTMKPVSTARDLREKAAQRALMQYRNPKNHALVISALRRAGREDLIGYGPQCLVRPGNGNFSDATPRHGSLGTRIRPAGTGAHPGSGRRRRRS